MSRLFNTSSFRAPVGRNEPGPEIAGAETDDKAVAWGAPTVTLTPRNRQALLDKLNAVKAAADKTGWRPYTPLAKGK
jgi:hypothetical protein